MSDEAIYSQAALEAAVAAAVEDARRGSDVASFAPTLEAAALEATIEERERIKAIFDCDDAKGRMKFARHLALSTDLSPETAASVLSAAPLESDPAAIFAARVPRLTLAANAEQPAPANSFEAGKIAFATAAGKRSA